jgi:hypothetical protein
MRIIQNVAKTWARIQDGIVRVIQLAPSPAQPGSLRDQVQDVRPQHESAAACIDRSDPFPQAASRDAGDRLQQHRQQQRGEHIGRAPDEPKRQSPAPVTRPRGNKDAKQHQLHQAGSGGGRRVSHCEPYHRERRKPQPFAGPWKPEHCRHADHRERRKLIALSQVRECFAHTRRTDPGSEAIRCAEVLAKRKRRADDCCQRPSQRDRPEALWM